MNSKKSLLLLSFAAIFVLSSCSGLKTPCTVNCGGGGNATLILTLRATPLTPPASTNLLTFFTSITGVSINPSSGANHPTITNTPSLDFVRLQSNSLVVGTATLPAGSYTGITISFSAPAATFCTQTTPGLAGCTSGSLTTVTGGISAPTIPLSLTVSGNQVIAVEVDLSIATALTVNASQVVTAVNLGATNAFSASLLPPAASSLAAGQFDFFENILGVVTAVSGQSVTIQTLKYGTIVATGTTSTYYAPNCLVTGAACSPAVGQFVSVDTAINADGSLALLLYDPLNSAAMNWVDGIVTTNPTSDTQFQIVAGDQATTSAANGSMNPPSGAIVNVTLSNLSQSFLVDSRGLTPPANSFQNSSSATNMLAGMTVGLEITKFTAAAGNTPASITADLVVLRPSYISGLIAAPVTSSTFYIQSVPPFFGLTGSYEVELGTTPPTNFDGVTSATNLNVGGTVAISGLYFGPTAQWPFVATKVRAF